MSTHITGKLILAGDYTEDEQLDPEAPLARVTIVMPREALRDVASLPMYQEVTVIKAAGLTAIRARLATLESELAGDMRPAAVLRRDNDELRDRLAGKDAKLAAWSAGRVVRGETADEIEKLTADLAVSREAHEPLVLCLEICRAALEHHEEISDEHGAAEMHRHLYATMSLAIKTLEEHRGAVGAAGDATYWQRISAYQAKYNAR